MSLYFGQGQLYFYFQYSIDKTNLFSFSVSIHSGLCILNTDSTLRVVEGRWRNGKYKVQILEGIRQYFLPKFSPTLWFTQLPTQWVPKSYPSNDLIKNEWIYNSTYPYAFMAWIGKSLPLSKYRKYGTSWISEKKFRLPVGSRDYLLLHNINK